MLLTNLTLAFSLAVDAALVSLALGIKHRKTLTWQWIFGIALCFGIFQAVMPLLGWLLGAIILSVVEAIDHWVAFGLLVVVGGNMIRNAWRDDDDQKPIGILHVKTIITLGVATSIDALAVGFTLPAISNQPLMTITTIGVVTTFLCLLAFVSVNKIPKWIANPSEYLAGAILIGLGVKILVEQFLL